MTSSGPKAIVIGAAAREYLDRLRATWKPDQELYDKHGVSAGNGSFQAAFLRVDVRIAATPN